VDEFAAANDAALLAWLAATSTPAVSSATRYESILLERVSNRPDVASTETLAAVNTPCQLRLM
jgi:hypothetical protein